VHVHVEVDVLDAALLLPMAASGAPRTIAQAHVSDVGEHEAAPLAARRQLAARRTAELKRQHLLLAARVADDVRAQLAVVSAVHACHLLLFEDGLAEEAVGGEGTLLASRRYIWAIVILRSAHFAILALVARIHRSAYSTPEGRGTCQHRSEIVADDAQGFSGLDDVRPPTPTASHSSIWP
jgi:hypothetical protein